MTIESTIPTKRGALVDDGLPEVVRAHDIGRRYFQTFLLAGERNVVSSMRRANTAEAHAAELLEAVSPEYRDLMANYFRRQSALGPVQRAELLGPLARLKITDALTVGTVAGDLLAGGPTAEAIEAAAGARSGADAGLSATPDKLRLMLDWYKVEDTQDWAPIATRDEVTLALVAVDETGDVASVAHHIGSLGKGQTKSYPHPGLKLYGFDMTEGSTFPKAYSVTLYAMDRDDDGGYNQFLGAAAKYAKEQVKAEMIARGINIFLGNTLPPEILIWVASVLKGLFDGLINWLAGLLKDEDDVLGQTLRTATVGSYGGVWSATGTLEAEHKQRVISGKGGRHRFQTYWVKTA